MRYLVTADNGGVEKSPWPLFSADGAWWWSGAEWLPAVSPDSRCRWTGWTWVRRPYLQRLPKWFLRDTVIWMVLLTAWVPALMALEAAKASTSAFIDVGTLFGAVSVASMFGFGIRLGRLAGWRELGLACVVGTGALLAWYIAATLTAPDPTGQNDHAAGAGTVILAIPTFVILVLIVGLGGVVGRATRRRWNTS